MNRSARVLILSMTVMQFGLANGSYGQTGSPIKISGDLRFRDDAVDVENKDVRNRERIRARLGLSMAVNEDFSAGLKIVSGSGDPVSTNQALGDAFTGKGIRLDRAVIEWRPSRIEGLEIAAGKMGNPFLSPGGTELIWDNDLSPEGIAITAARKVGMVTLDVSTAHFIVNERSAANDGALIGGQAVAGLDTPAAGVRIGAGYFDYQNTRNQPTYYDAADSFGNTVTPGGLYRYDYNQFEVLGSVTPVVLPGNVTVFADFVKNVAEDVEEDTGWLAGVSAGTLKEPGSFGFRYSYRDLERDAVLGAFTDSDFINGGTDGKGHEVNIDFQAAARTVLNATYFHNTLSSGEKFHRVQLDVVVKF